MTILLTGATGFVGLALTRQLHQQDRPLIAAVRRVGNTLPAAIQQVPVGDLLPNNDWEAALDPVDTVIHLAARVHIMRDTAVDPLTVFRQTNTVATLNLAQQAAEAGVRRFIFLSSIKVNGESTTSRPFNATDLCHPTDPYALSKYEAEQSLMQVAQETGMEVVIIRPPLVYGPNVKGNFQQLMNWVYKGIPLPLGAIKNKRSFLALDNLTDLIMICIEHPAAANEIFLASDGQDLSTTEWLKRLGHALNCPTRLLPIPQTLLALGLQTMGKANIAQRLCGSLHIDMTKTQQLLSWHPPFTVEDALDKMAKAWLTQHHSRHSSLS